MFCILRRTALYKDDFAKLHILYNKFCKVLEKIKILAPEIYDISI
ncbi:MAG: hypothetical protein AB8U25_07050 [Rickettsiales endosymbiont of Dermacentor nuttalli]